MKPMHWITFVSALAATATQAADRPAGIPGNYQLLYEQTFESEAALAGFVMSDPAAWKWVKDEHGTAMELVKQSKYEPPFRSPINIALVTDRVFGDFVLEADLMQTGREYGHRDMCIYFDFQGPSKFYYVHIATAADPNAHNVFIVNEAARTNIAKETTKGAKWGLNVSHRIRIERTASDGTINVYFDDVARPIMRATDKTFPSGQIGFGSFDDTGRVDNVRIWGTSVEQKKTSPFRRNGR